MKKEKLPTDEFLVNINETNHLNLNISNFEDKKSPIDQDIKIKAKLKKKAFSNICFELDGFSPEDVYITNLDQSINPINNFRRRIYF